VFAAPVDKTLGAGSAVSEPVILRFRREGQAEEAPTHLDLVGTVDQWVRFLLHGRESTA